MATLRKKRPSVPGPDQPPFITDDDMPPGSLDPTDGLRPGRALTQVFVVTTAADGHAVPRAAFRTATAAADAAGRLPSGADAQVYGLVLFPSADDWRPDGAGQH